MKQGDSELFSLVCSRDVMTGIPKTRSNIVPPQVINQRSIADTCLCTAIHGRSGIACECGFLI